MIKLSSVLYCEFGPAAKTLCNLSGRAGRHDSPAGGQPARAHAVPRDPGCNLGLGRENGPRATPSWAKNSSPPKARWTPTVDLDRMAIRSSRRNKTAWRLTLHPVNPSSFYFVPFLCLKRTRRRVAAPPRLPRQRASRSGHRLHGQRPEPLFSLLLSTAFSAPHRAKRRWPRPPVAPWGEWLRHNRAGSTRAFFSLPFFLFTQRRARCGVRPWRPEGRQRRRDASRRCSHSPVGERATIEQPCGGAWARVLTTAMWRRGLVSSIQDRNFYFLSFFLWFTSRWCISIESVTTI
jgi:hypothetical protein